MPSISEREEGESDDHEAPTEVPNERFLTLSELGIVGIHGERGRAVECSETRERAVAPAGTKELGFKDGHRYFVKPVPEGTQEMLKASAEHYVENARRFSNGLSKI